MRRLRRLAELAVSAPLLELGMNDDGRGRRVFDGVIITSPAPLV
jgi:hypothetical protein